MRNCPKCGPGYPRTSPTGVGISHSHPAIPVAPDRPGDRDQQQAAEERREQLGTALDEYVDTHLWSTFGALDALMPVVEQMCATEVAAARAEEAARWQAKIEALVEDMTEAIDSGYYGGSEYEDAAARLRALLDAS